MNFVTPDTVSQGKVVILIMVICYDCCSLIFILKVILAFIRLKRRINVTGWFVSVRKDLDAILSPSFSVKICVPSTYFETLDPL